MPQRLFVFVQMEFPWALGPADGRYLLRGERDGEAEHVVVLSTLSAPRRAAGVRGGVEEMRGPLGSLARRVGLGGKPSPATPEPAPVATARATVIDPVSLSAEHQARAWLADMDAEHEAGDALAVLNRVLADHRVACADPYTHEVSISQALVIRAGFGEGEQVAEGRWLHADELPPRAVEASNAKRSRQARASGRIGGSRARSAVLRPQERLAALLGARERSLVCEELTLRARADLDHGRLPHAAIELDGAIALAVRELRSESRHDLALRVAELEQLAGGVAAQAQTAREGRDGELDGEVLVHALERLEAALRARTAPGFNLA